MLLLLLLLPHTHNSAAYTTNRAPWSLLLLLLLRMSAKTAPRASTDVPAHSTGAPKHDISVGIVAVVLLFKIIRMHRAPQV